jgi:hypothetical protein
VRSSRHTTHIHTPASPGAVAEPRELRAPLRANSPEIQVLDQSNTRLIQLPGVGQVGLTPPVYWVYCVRSGALIVHRCCTYAHNKAHKQRCGTQTQTSIASFPNQFSISSLPPHLHSVTQRTKRA